DGRVEVYTLDGRLLAAVPAGHAWSPDAPSAQKESSSASQEESSSAAQRESSPSAQREIAPVASKESSPSAQKESSPAPKVASPGGALVANVSPRAIAAPAHERPAAPSVAAALDRARSALADGDAPRARHWLDEALAARPQTRDRAEAELFWAESYLVEQEPDRALAAFRRVADTYARLPEGESAAFAAAQVLFERGHKSEAAEALRAYLERYPNGRFAREARDRIAELPTAP